MKQQQQLSESEQTDQIKWELLKYKIRKFESSFPEKSHKTKKEVSVN